VIKEQCVNEDEFLLSSPFSYVITISSKSNLMLHHEEKEYRLTTSHSMNQNELPQSFLTSSEEGLRQGHPVRPDVYDWGCGVGCGGGEKSSGDRRLTHIGGNGGGIGGRVMMDHEDSFPSTNIHQCGIQRRQR
jgi:hypothetical protein